MTAVEASLGVTGGVDTHLDTHVAAVLDPVGGLLGVESFPATPAGYRSLVAWMGGFGPVARVGVEGTGSYGAGLARFLHRAGVAVIEVDRANRQARRALGKSDPADAVEAARAAQGGRARAVAKSRDGTAEAIRAVMVARRSASETRAKTIVQIRHLCVTGPDELRTRMKGLSPQAVAQAAASLRPRPGGDVVAFSTKVALRSLGRRVAALAQELVGLDVLAELVADHAPALLALPGVGVQTAAALLVAAGDNPQRLRSEPAWAHLCGVAPLEAFFSSRVVVANCPRGGSVVNVGDGASSYRRRREPTSRERCRSGPRRAALSIVSGGPA